jgi:hypothetical protein
MLRVSILLASRGCHEYLLSDAAEEGIVCLSVCDHRAANLLVCDREVGPLCTGNSCERSSSA